MSDLIITQISGEFRVDSRTMAERLGNKHKSVMELISKNDALFAGFGQVPFQTETVRNSVGAVNQAHFALLNEDQCYFLLTLVRNSPKVTDLKAGLIHAFRKARMALDMSDPLAVAQAYVLAETERRQLTLKIQEDAPKVQAHDALMRTEGLYSIQAAGKILGWGEIKLYQWLRENGILMSRERNGDALHNIPYQTHMDAGRFEVKTRAVVMGNTERMVSTPYVTAKGLDYLFKRLEGKPRPLQLPMIGAAVPA